MQTRTKAETEAGIAESGMVIERRFTTAGDDPFDTFDWIEMDVEIRNPDGSIADTIEGVKLPNPATFVTRLNNFLIKSI